MGLGIFTEKNYRKYAHSQKFSHKANKSKKILRKYWENFLRNYAFFYMQGVGIFTEITVLRYTLK